MVTTFSATRRSHRRGQVLVGSVEELRENYAAFEAGFRRFFPDLVRFVREGGGLPVG